jgi:hypothetical protein
MSNSIDIHLIVLEMKDVVRRTRTTFPLREAAHRHASRHVTVKTRCLRHETKKWAQLKRMRLWKPLHIGLSHDADVSFGLFCLMSWCLSWRSWCAAALSVQVRHSLQWTIHSLTCPWGCPCEKRQRTLWLRTDCSRAVLPSGDVGTPHQN